MGLDLNMLGQCLFDEAMIGEKKVKDLFFFKEREANIGMEMEVF